MYYWYQSGFLLTAIMYRFIFIQKASIKYTISGEPMVRKEIYINHVLIRVGDRPILSPIAAHTPNNFHSIKYLRRFMLLI